MSTPPVLQSPSLSALPGVRHAFFTRRGGVSRGVYDSLNVGVGSADDPAAVAENRRRAAAVFGVGPENLITCYQIHSERVVETASPWRERPQADGVATRAAGLVCGALAADCAPVLMADAEARVAAAVHAGWRGALEGVVEAGVAAMVALGAAPEGIVAAVGPCIGQASYEVGAEFVQAFEDRSPDFARFFASGAAPDKRQFDLPGFVLSRLEAAGVLRREWIGRDTCAEGATFFSNRRAFRRGEADYGRLLSAVMLEP